LSSHIPNNYKPGEMVYRSLWKLGAPAEFVDSQLDSFLIYWLDLKEKKQEKGKKTSWDMTCRNWMARAWQGKAGREWEDRRHRNRTFGGPRADLFDTASATRLIGKINNADCNEQCEQR